ncbi:hypothetical protein Dimus_028520, partial [Dionaea muscipula]
LKMEVDDGSRSQRLQQELGAVAEVGGDEGGAGGKLGKEKSAPKGPGTGGRCPFALESWFRSWVCATVWAWPDLMVRGRN